MEEEMRLIFERIGRPLTEFERFLKIDEGLIPELNCIQVTMHTPILALRSQVTHEAMEETEGQILERQKENMKEELIGRLVSMIAHHTRQKTESDFYLTPRMPKNFIMCHPETYTRLLSHIRDLDFRLDDGQRLRRR